MKNGRSDLNCKKQHQLRCTAIWDCQNLSSQLCGLSTGKSFSEALILASVIPQYDKILFIEFPEKYKFRTCCVQKLLLFFVLTFKTIIVHNMLWTCIFLGIQWTISRHINCGLTGARMRASEKDLPVCVKFIYSEKATKFCKIFP